MTRRWFVSLLLVVSVVSCKSRTFSDVQNRSTKRIGIVYDEHPSEQAIDLIAQGIRNSGAEVDLIPHQDGIEDILNRVDGVVFPGGNDVDSSMYGGDPDIVDPSQPSKKSFDLFEQYVFERVVEQRKRPALGICRGMQLINVFRGGTLIQDIPTQRPSNIRHSNADHSPAEHAINIFDPRSTIATALGQAGQFLVNSYHHQAVDKVGRQLKVTGAATDKIVEVIESEGGAWILGVQFHPEAFVNDNSSGGKRYQRIFKSLVDAAAL